jgi:hypothetical protein
MLCIEQHHRLGDNGIRTVLPHRNRKEMRKMPWYTNPDITCRVLNRIATRYNQSALQDLTVVLDNAVALILRKLEHYHHAANRQQ